jgi:hypothetical protein
MSFVIYGSTFDAIISSTNELVNGISKLDSLTKNDLIISGYSNSTALNQWSLSG